MIAVVGDPDVILRVDAETMRIAEHASAPGAKVLSLSVEHDQGIRFVASLKDIYLSFRVHGHCRHTAEFPTCRHRVRLFAKPDVDAVLQQTAFMRIPALFGSPNGRNKYGTSQDLSHVELP